MSDVVAAAKVRRCAAPGGAHARPHFLPPPLAQLCFYHRPSTQPSPSIGRRGNSFKNRSPAANLAGGAAALKKPASAKKVARDDSSKRRDVSEKPKLSWWMIGLMFFAVVMYPISQLLANNLLGKGTTRLPSA